MDNNLQFLSGSWDNSIKLWQNKENIGINSKPLLTYNIDCEVRCISNCKIKKNIIISGDENGNIYMFDKRISNKYIRLWSKAHKDEITSISFLPNKFEFISSSSDCYLKYFNAQNGKIISQISTRENLNNIQTDDKYILSGGELGTIRLFDIDNNNNNIKECINNNHNQFKLKTNDPISKIYCTNNSKYIIIGTKQYTNNVHIFHNKNNNNYNHIKTRSLPPSFTSSLINDTTTNHNNNNNNTNKRKQNKNSKTYSFGSSAFAKLTQSASNLFSFGSNDQK